MGTFHDCASNGGTCHDLRTDMAFGHVKAIARMKRPAAAAAASSVSASAPREVVKVACLGLHVMYGYPLD